MTSIQRLAKKHEQPCQQGRERTSVAPYMQVILIPDSFRRQEELDCEDDTELAGHGAAMCVR